VNKFPNPDLNRSTVVTKFVREGKKMFTESPKEKVFKTKPKQPDQFRMPPNFNLNKSIKVPKSK